MKLFYRETGKGCPLIILHGLYGSSDNWMNYAKQLGKYFKVYVPDQRNHGQSPHHENNSYTALCEDMMEFIKDYSIEKPVIIGHSMGGKTAMYMAAEYPELVRALIVIDISPRTYNEDSGSTPGYLQHSNIIRILSELPVENFKTREDADRELSGHIRSLRIRQFLLKNLTRNKSGVFTWKINIAAIKNNVENIFAGLDKALIKPGDYPVLFIKGAQSDYINEDDIRLIKEFYPNANIHTIEGAGHWIHVEKPDELSSSIIHFLKIQHLCD